MNKLQTQRLLAGIIYLLVSTLLPCRALPTGFTVAGPGLKSPHSKITLQYDAAAKQGFDWKELSKLPLQPRNPTQTARGTVQYLNEAVRRMTGQELLVQSSNDLSKGIVLVLFKNAPAAIKNDPHIQHALRDTGEDGYNANEAFFISSESDRVLIVANTTDGWGDAVVELLESVGYEVLGMGPNWIHVPDYRNKSLVFSLQKMGRPGFYLRNLGATSGQNYGVGTLTEVTNPEDESVRDSYQRWRFGTRMGTQSMPAFPGHAMQGYHKPVVEKMLATGSNAGFLRDKTVLGKNAQRPPTTPENKRHLWLNTDAVGTPGAGQAFISNGTEWAPENLGEIRAGLDLSVPFVREIILDTLKKRSEAQLLKTPDELFIFPTDPEDGAGYTHLGRQLNQPNWYPEYLKQEGIKFGQPYVLHGFKGLDQPREKWNSQFQADTVFGFNNWLLHEYDKWIDSLPAADRVTSSGESKKALVRTSLFSYGFHDVPPSFNLDPRIRVMIASYPKHRGRGEWKRFSSYEDIAAAFRKLLPREPSGAYWIISLAYYRDYSTADLHGSRLPAAIWESVRKAYDAGFRAVTAEMDFNFGKQGLEYYLYSKMLWNPHLSLEELEVLRDRWLQRAFGSGWQEMKTYYNFMAPENFTVNAPNNWAKAIRLIDVASQRIDSSKEPDVQQRIDDLKQFWYFYYLVESNQATSASPTLKEFVWKGQMSYMTAQHVVTRRFFKTNKAKDAASSEFSTDRAHYTHRETQVWWTKVLDFWRVTPVTDFTGALLADGSKGSTVDTNDLTRVSEFGQEPPRQPFIYNSGQIDDLSFLTVASRADENIGGKLFWPWLPDYPYNNYERDVPYGIRLWNAEKKIWDELVDETTTTVRGHPFSDSKGKEFRVAEVAFAVPRPGTYRITLGRAGNSAQLTSLNYDPARAEYFDTGSQTYSNNSTGHTQSPVCFYIPKGTKSIDLEVWDTHNNKKLQLHTGLPTSDLKKTRIVDVSARGTHVVKLESGEDGSIAILSGNGFAFPYLYSVPMLWAKSPSQLLVPRAIAEADGLTITTDP